MCVLMFWGCTVIQWVCSLSWGLIQRCVWVKARVWVENRWKSLLNLFKVDFYSFSLCPRQLLQVGGSQGCLNLWKQQRLRVSRHFPILSENRVWLLDKWKSWDDVSWWWNLLGRVLETAAAACCTRAVLSEAQKCFVYSICLFDTL